MLVPSFTDVNYFFQLNVLGFSKFTYSMLNLVAFIALLCGAVIYNSYLQQWEIRTLLQISQVCNLLSSLTTLMVVLKWNRLIGMSDLMFVFLTQTFSQTLSLAFS